MPGKLVDAKAVVLLSPCRLDDAVAPVEVLLQEGLGVVSVPADGPLTPAMLRATFGRRLTVGVHDLLSVDQAQWAVEQEAAFALTMGRPEVTAVLSAAGLPASRSSSLDSSRPIASSTAPTATPRRNVSCCR